MHVYIDHMLSMLLSAKIHTYMDLDNGVGRRRGVGLTVAAFTAGVVRGSGDWLVNSSPLPLLRLSETIGRAVGHGGVNIVSLAYTILTATGA